MWMNGSGSIGSIPSNSIHDQGSVVCLEEREIESQERLKVAKKTIQDKRKRYENVEHTRVQVKCIIWMWTER